MGMYKKLVNILMVAATLTVLAACSSRVRIVDFQDQEIISRQELTLDQVETSIINAGKMRGWVVRVQGPGHATAKLSTRTHVAEVDVYYSHETYSIIYKNSVDLNFKKGKIHGNYNRWVANLNRDILGALPP
jgi:hypothetical protein